MAGKTKTSKSNEAYFKAYDPVKQKAKIADKHLKAHPNDLQSIERPKADYRKKKRGV